MNPLLQHTVSFEVIRMHQIVMTVVELWMSGLGSIPTVY